MRNHLSYNNESFDSRITFGCYLEQEPALGDLRKATERTIGLLKERRAALIAAAVTGKLDVSQTLR